MKSPRFKHSPTRLALGLFGLAAFGAHLFGAVSGLTVAGTRESGHDVAKAQGEHPLTSMRGEAGAEPSAPNGTMRRALHTPAKFTGAAPNRSLEAFLHLPLSFEPAPERAGHSASSFVTRGPGYAVWLSPTAAVVSVAESASWEEGESGDGSTWNPVPWPARAFARSGVSSNRGTSRAAPFLTEKSPRQTERPAPDLVTLELVGANASARAQGLDLLPGKSNYFIGTDPKAWRTNVPTFARVRYEGVYPGVDLVYYGNPQRLEYDFVVRPGADMKAIRFVAKNGAGKLERALRISRSGDLVIPTEQGEIRLRKPIVYQEEPGGGRASTGFSSQKFEETEQQSATTTRRLVESRYVLTSAGEVSFQVSGYDLRRALVIDPTLEYSSFLGGSGWDFGVSAAVGLLSAGGNLYIASGTASANFPGTSGGYQGASAGCNLGGGQICGDAFVTKINTSGTAVLYSAYLGGSGADGAYGLAVDRLGNAYVTGPTDSTNFPTTAGAYQSQFGGDTPGCASAGIWPPCGDAFVAKLDPTGSNLTYSTYLGGSADDYAEAVAVDGSGNAYVTGLTNSTDYPTTPGAFQQTNSASCGGTPCGTLFVSKLNAAGSSLTYSTYVGGSGGSFAAAIAVNPAGEAYITGSGNWVDFPTTPNAYQPNDNGGSVVVKLDATGGSLLYSTYLGGSSWELGLGVAVDASGNAYVVGITASSDFPVTAGAFQTSLSNWNDFHGYVAKFDPSAPGESSLVFSSLLGGSVRDGVTGVAVDRAGIVFLAGGTSSPDFPTVSPLQGLLADGTGCGAPCGDAFVAVMNATGSQLLFSTFLGGTGAEFLEFLAADDGRDGSGVFREIYVGGGTTSSRYPTTAGAFQNSFGGGGADMFVAKIDWVAMNTSNGTNVAVQPTGSVSLTFDAVTTAGTTAVTETTVGTAPPAGFSLGTPAVYYDISTTATFSGQATVCLSYAGVSFAGGLPALFHYENSNWVNVTTSVDSVNQVICGRVTSFSPFAVFGADYSASVQAPISADGTSTFKAQRGSVPVKFTLSLGGEPTCDLPPATISLHRDSASSGTTVDENVYDLPSDAGSQFRIDSTTCQYVYNVGARSLGPGTYRVEISIHGTPVGSATFALQ